MLVLVGNLKVDKPMLCCIFLQIQHRFLHKSHLLYHMYAYFLNYYFRIFIIWERNGSFKSHAWQLDLTLVIECEFVEGFSTWFLSHVFMHNFRSKVIEDQGVRQGLNYRLKAKRYIGVSVRQSEKQK